MSESAHKKPPKRQAAAQPGVNQAVATHGQFRMRIEDISSIRGRGTLVTGPIEQGAVAAGDGVEIVGSGAKPTASIVLAVTVSGKLIERGHAGDTVGVLLRGVDANKVTRGQMLRAT
jgi:elongation factor Tu